MRLLLALLTLVLAACSEAVGPDTGGDSGILDLSREWQTAQPGDVGMDATQLLAAGTAAGGIPRVQSLLVARHGRLVLERYYNGAGRESLLDVRSVTKSVVSLLTGIAIAEGIIPDADAEIGPWLENTWTLDANDRQVTVRDLLTMTGGWDWFEAGAVGYNDWILSADRVQYLLDRPHTAAPGVTFTYNSAAVHLLGVVLAEAAGQSLPAFADAQLFGPLGITQRQWEDLGDGYVNGGAGLDLRGRDLLRLGQLLLQGGRSGDEVIVPEDWIAASTATTFALNTTLGAQSGVGYGYLWWTADANPARARFGWGYGGQFVYVAPDLDLVVVATTDWRLLPPELPAGELARRVFNVIITGVVPAARQ